MGTQTPLSEWIAPSKAGKSAEIRIVGVDFSLVFNCQSSYVSIGNQIPAHAGRSERSAE